MADINIAVIYYSSTGGNYQMSKWAAETAKAEGAEVRMHRVRELAPKEAIEANPAWKKHYEATKDEVPEAKVDDLDWADAIIFSVPTRYGQMPAQIKQFLDETGPLWAKGKLVDKVATGFTSAQNPHGGQETTLFSLYTTLIHLGMIVVTPGYSDQSVFQAGGNPYGTSTTISGEGEIKDDIKAAIEHQVKRTIRIAKAVKAAK